MRVREQRQTGVTRRALKSAAAALFAERGYSGTTLDLIAEASGANKAMVAYYFGDKAGLYRAILEDGVDAVLARADAGVDAGAAPAERLSAHIGAIAEGFAAQPHLPRMLLREYLAGGGAQEDERAALKLAALYRRTEEILADGAARGVFRPADAHETHLSLIGALAFFDLTAAFRSAMASNDAWDIGAPDRDAYVEHLRTLFLQGLASD